MTQKLSEIWLYISAGDLEVEAMQCRDEGKDLGPLQAEFDRVKATDLQDPANQPAAEALLDATIKLPTRPGYPFAEPSDLEGIRAARGPAVELPPLKLSKAKLKDKIHGAWLGRACGCLLGKPVECWRSPRMWGYLKDSNRWPLADYFTRNVPDAVREKHQIPANWFAVEDLTAMPEDDDTNYTTCGLALMAEHGAAFTPWDVARFWMLNLPILHTCTAERAAYRNFCVNVFPPASASFRNPYREWIGAQIRADFFGYAAPGNPQRAAEWAWRDASISHVKNGIYGEMWAAAMVAAAFVTDDIPTIIRAGLAQVPAACRLAKDVSDVLAWHAGGTGYDQAVEQIHRRWDENHGYGWCHTISNAMIVAAGLLWGERDYARSICRAVQCCFDTDCNGATVGSIVGAVLGAKALPAQWTAPVHDTLVTGVAGYNRVRISDLARRTMEVIAKA